MEKMKMAKQGLVTFDKYGAVKRGSIQDIDVELQTKDAFSQVDAKVDDDCPVCDYNLYLTKEITKRIAIMDDEEVDVISWICPDCFSQFDMEDNPEILLSSNNIQAQS